MERDPSNETNTGYAIPDKDELFGDAADRVAIRRPAPLIPRVEAPQSGPGIGLWAHVKISTHCQDATAAR